MILLELLAATATTKSIHREPACAIVTMKHLFVAGRDSL
jgi:hypothetical protein